MDERDARKSLGSAIAGGRLSPDRIREESRAWGLVLDPDGAEPAYEEQRKRRFFRLTRQTSGGYNITGFAPEVEGAAMRTLLDAYLAPRTQDPLPLPFPGSASGDAPSDGHTGRALGSGEHAPEERTRDQKALDALCHILRLHAASANAPTVGGAAPTLLVTASLAAIATHQRSCPDDRTSRPALTAVPGGQADTTPGGVPAGPVDVQDGTRADAHNGTRATAQDGAPVGVQDGARVAAHDGAPVGVQDGTPVEKPENSRFGAPSGVPADTEVDSVLSMSDLPTDGRGLPDVQALIDRRFARLGRDGTPVPLSAVMHLLCDAAVQLLVTDELGVPLKLGRAQRLFSKHQRRVIAARDHHCRAPGCNIPAAWCEIHHVVPWQHGGPTDVSNAVMLCSFHHHEIDRGRLRVVHHPGGDIPAVHRYTVEATWAPRGRTPVFRETG